MSLVKSSITVGFYTFLSRIFGFVRDAMMANAIGASWLSDAFFVAFKLPNFFRRLFGEGAFNSAFVPMFAGTLASDGKEEAVNFARDVMSIMLVVLLVLCAIFIAIMPWWLHVFAAGFTDNPEKFATTVELARICFPYILFISLVSLLGGVLNSVERFAAVAISPVMLNLCMIAAMLWLTSYTATPAHALAWGVVGAGITQLLWLIYSCHKAGVLPKIRRPRLTPNVKKMLVLFAPAALGAGVVQVNLLVDVIIGSFIPDGVSFLYYADRINEFPIGVIGVAVGTTLLPMLSKQIRTGDKDAANVSMNRAIELVMLFAIPCAVAFAVVAEPIIYVIYERGAFTPEDTLATTHALMAFAIGLPAFIVVKVLAPGFFANHDTKTPFTIAIVCVFINFALNLALMGPMAHVGLALATTISGWVNAIAMAVILHKRKLYTPDHLIKMRLLKITLASALMGVATYYFYHAAQSYFYTHLWMKIGALSALVMVGLVSYGICILLLKAYDIKSLKNTL